MLFNSFEFIFAFLPAVIAIYYILGKKCTHGWVKAWLVLSSLYFYSFWNIRFLPLLIISILFNYCTGRFLSARRTKWVFTAGIIFNLGLLAYYKYANFFITNISHVFGWSVSTLKLILPLAISFFTFQQIAYLADSYKTGDTQYSLLDYTLFVAFFPQLIAGPIVHHRHFINQLQKDEVYLVNYENISKGIVFFTLGLFKKVIVADSLSLLAVKGFDATAIPDALNAWIAALSYTFQLYFDFSGYSEMALGLGLFFNLSLPVNFESPYRASSIIDFWKRWHITLSVLMKDYIYIPLGGNRKGKARKYFNLMITMLLGGLWHGAGWTYIAWGAFHGVALSLNHAFRDLLKSPVLKYFSVIATAGMYGHNPLGDMFRSLSRAASRLATFLCISAGWVLFRSHSLGQAFRFLGSMSGLYNPKLNGSSPISYGSYTLFLLFSLFLLLSFIPGTVKAMQRFKPKPAWLIASAALSIICFLNISRISEFLYFQF